MAETAEGCPQTPCQDEPAEDKVGKAQGFVQEERSHDHTIEGKGVVENHGAAGTQSLDRPVPRPEADDGGNEADVDDGRDRLSTKVQRDVPEFDIGGTGERLRMTLRPKTE